jgi:recombination protein RecT
MSPEDMVRLGLMAVSRNPKLLQCSAQSVLRALMDAADVRIRPLGTNGRGYLIPRKNKNTCQLEACFDPGYRGLKDICMRSGDVVDVDAYPVYANDQFSYTLGDDPTVSHVPPQDLTVDRGALVGSYAVANMKNGKKKIEVVPKKDLDKIRDTSPSKEGPWKTWEEEMARKSAMRRIAKWLPVDDPSLEHALELANEVDKPEAALPHGDTRELENALMGDVVVTADGEVVS